MHHLNIAVYFEILSTKVSIRYLCVIVNLGDNILTPVTTRSILNS